MAIRDFLSLYLVWCGRITILSFFLEGQAPQIEECPESQTIRLSPGETETEANWAEPSFDDNVEVIEVVPNIPPGSPLSEGSHQIVYTASDDAGFSTECRFTVHVVS